MGQSQPRLRVGSLTQRCALCARGRIFGAERLCRGCKETWAWSREHGGFFRRDPWGNPFLAERELGAALQMLFPGQTILNSFRPLWCLSSKGVPLEYDYFLPGKKLLFELNGAQHMAPSAWIDGARRALSAWKTRKAHDEQKANTASRFGLTLIIIPYKRPITIAWVNTRIEQAGAVA